MVAHFTTRTYGVNQKFRFDEGIWLHRKSGQIRFFFGKYHFLHYACAACSEQTFNKNTMEIIHLRPGEDDILLQTIIGMVVNIVGNFDMNM